MNTIDSQYKYEDTTNATHIVWYIQQSTMTQNLKKSNAISLKGLPVAWGWQQTLLRRHRLRNDIKVKKMGDDKLRFSGKFLWAVKGCKFSAEVAIRSRVCKTSSTTALISNLVSVGGAGKKPGHRFTSYFLCLETMPRLLWKVNMTKTGKQIVYLPYELTSLTTATA